jgi:hypothetical protein
MVLGVLLLRARLAAFAPFRRGILRRTGGARRWIALRSIRLRARRRIVAARLGCGLGGGGGHAECERDRGHAAEK